MKKIAALLEYDALVVTSSAPICVLAAPALIRRHSGLVAAGDARLGCIVRRWRAEPTSVRHGTLGWSKGAAVRPPRTFWTGSPRA